MEPCNFAVSVLTIFWAEFGLIITNNEIAIPTYASLSVGLMRTNPVAGILSRVCVGYSTGILCSLSDWLAAQTSFRQLPSF
jgi:hypothetical protein